jgi:hypothetical protein
MKYKETFWFKHDFDAADDDKTILLIEQLGLEGYGIYWVLIEKLRGREGYKLPFSIIPSLARRYMTTPEKMKAVVMQYGLFEYDEEGFFYSVSLIERMLALDSARAKRSIAGKIGMENRWKAKRLENKAVEECEEVTPLLQDYNNVITPLLQDYNTDITSYNYKNRIDKIREDKNREEYKEKEDNKLSSKKKFNFKEALIELGVDEAVASDWIEVRKLKKAAQTQTAFKKIKSQIERSGMSANDCVTIAVERSWAGFNPDWLQNVSAQEKTLFNNENNNTDGIWQTV